MPTSSSGITVPSRLSRPVAWHSAHCCLEDRLRRARRAPRRSAADSRGGGSSRSQSSRSCMRWRKNGVFVRLQAERGVDQHRAERGRVAGEVHQHQALGGRSRACEVGLERVIVVGPDAPRLHAHVEMPDRREVGVSTLSSRAVRRKLNLVRFIGASRPGPQRGRLARSTRTRSPCCDRAASSSIGMNTNL